MITNTVIEEVKERLIELYNPLEIYLFGSYICGCADEESDLDALIVVDKYQKDHYHDLVEGHKALCGITISKDLFLFNKEEFEKDSQNRTTFCYKIKQKGKKIYAKP